MSAKYKLRITGECKQNMKLQHNENKTILQHALSIGDADSPRLITLLRPDSDITHESSIRIHPKAAIPRSECGARDGGMGVMESGY
ncbi:MAG: hypothetical protein IJ614_01165 [Prevotella sp.]|nr:hypothetical protein [Prevotella sp.]